MSRKQSPTRKELHRTNESAARKLSEARRAARTAKAMQHYRFGTESVK